jgi:hypothetical protein
MHKPKFDAEFLGKQQYSPRLKVANCAVWRPDKLTKFIPHHTTNISVRIGL